MPSPLPPGAEAGPREGGPRPGAVDGPLFGADGGDPRKVDNEEF